MLFVDSEQVAARKNVQIVVGDERDKFGRCGFVWFEFVEKPTAFGRSIRCPEVTPMRGIRSQKIAPPRKRHKTRRVRANGVRRPEISQLPLRYAGGSEE